MTGQIAQPVPPSARTPESALRSIEILLGKIIQAGGFALSVVVRKPSTGDPDAPEWIVDFSGPDADLLLAAHAELLDAFAHIAAKAARVEDELFTKISFDCRGARKMRAEELKLMAQLAAGRALDSGEPFALNPMNAADRWAVHLALKDRPDVRTESQGFGSARHVVILPSSPPPGRRR